MQQPVGANVGFGQSTADSRSSGDHSYASVGLVPIIRMMMMVMVVMVVMAVMVMVMRRATIVTVICEGRKGGKIVLQRKLHRSCLVAVRIIFSARSNYF